jgi:hypothetical protein
MCSPLFPHTKLIPYVTINMVALSDDNWLTVDDKQVGVGETRDV